MFLDAVISFLCRKIIILQGIVDLVIQFSAHLPVVPFRIAPFPRFHRPPYEFTATGENIDMIPE